MASEETILNATGTIPGFIGPVGLELDIVADSAVMEMRNFACGANDAGFHYINANLGRDIKIPEHVFDIRNVCSGDLSPDGKGTLEICRGIEVGHIFKLHTKYSQHMKANYLSAAGQLQNFEMGCYGIGISRIVAAAIEQNHDQRGIIFPESMAPFQLAIIPNPGPIGFEETFVLSQICHREGQPMGQVDIVIMPHKDQIVRTQRHRHIIFLANGWEASGPVDDPHFGMVEFKRLPLIIVEHNKLFGAGVILLQERVDGFFQEINAAVSGTNTTYRRRINQLVGPVTQECIEGSCSHPVRERGLRAGAQFLQGTLNSGALD